MNIDADNDVYYTRIRGRIQGPYTIDQLGRFASRGQFSRIHEVSADRIIWFPATQLSQVFTPVASVTRAAHKNDAQKLGMDGGQPESITPTNFNAGIARRAIVIGRAPDCDEVLDHPLVSQRHAQITFVGEAMFIEDLGTASGTFVNGVQVLTTTEIYAEDQIQIAKFAFVVGSDRSLSRRQNRGDITVEIRQVTIDLNNRRLLDNVSAVIYPSEFVGLMGPSGAGKSMLMSVLNGYRRPTGGNVLLNGDDLYSHFDLYRNQIGYVPQDDIIHPTLTVRQALYYTASLRLPRDYSDQDINLQIDRVLDQLGLTHVADVMIGSPEKRGVSGGQRKRVNLAMELLADPSLLLLDEPTSGLSSEDTLSVMRILRGLADQGKTIVLTIHAPSLEAFQLMDNLLLVAKDKGSPEPGRLAYYGPAFPDSIEFFRDPYSDAPQVPAPDEIFKGLERRRAIEWLTAYESSEYQRRYVVERFQRQSAPGLHSSEPRRTSTGWIAQFWTLARRCLTIKLRDTWNTLLLLIQAPVIAGLVVLVFNKKANKVIPNVRGIDFANPVNTSLLRDFSSAWHDVSEATATTMFLLALSAIWFGCSNSAREIVAERAIYTRERMVNLKIPCYIGSKCLILGAICFVQCAILLGIVYQGIGLHGNWEAIFGSLFLASLVGVVIGLLVSALAPTSEVALTLLPLVILPMVILAGVLQPLHQMDSVSRNISTVIPSRWAFESLLLLEVAHKPKATENALMHAKPSTSSSTESSSKSQASRKNTPSGAVAAPGSAEIAVERDMANHLFPHNKRTSPKVTNATLMGMLVCLIGVVAFALKRRDVT